MKTMGVSSVVCPNCGGQMEVNGVQEIVECPYCGNQYATSQLLNESDIVKAERIKAQTARDIEATRMRNQAEREQREETKLAVEKFKKSKFSKVLIIFAVVAALFCAVSFSDGRVLAGLCAAVMAGLFLISWLMGMNIIKEKKKGIRILAAIIAFLLFIPFIKLNNAGGTSYGSNPDDIDWEVLELGQYLPEPPNAYGEVNSDSEKYLSVSLCEIDKADFKSYMNDCMDAGYTIESEQTATSYEAFNADGYQVRVYFYSYSSGDELSIYLDAPEELGEYEWPTMGLGSMLPKMESDVGDISWDNSETFIVHVGNTSLEEYKEYVKACEAVGFVVDYSRDDDYYSAKNEDGYDLTLRYLGFERIEVSLKAPEGGVPAKDQEDTEQEASSEEIILVAGELGTYGKEVVFGKGTEFENIKYYYFVPAGTYVITNVGDYMGAYYVYFDGVNINEDGWEEPIVGDGGEVLDIGASSTVTIEENQAICIFEPDKFKLEITEAEQMEETEPVEETSTAVETTSGIRPEFKEAMDSYEAYFDDYCSFMKKYAESDGTDMTLLLDYTNHLSKYVETMEALEAWEGKDMNAEETAYYIQVQSRINAKLLEVVQ